MTGVTLTTTDAILKTLWPQSRVDDMVYAAGAQPTFRAAALFGIAQAARLDGGRYMLMNMVYSLSGRADEASVYEDVVAAMKMAPAGIVPANVAIEPPELGGPVWNVKRVGGRLEMNGWLAADGDRVALVAAAQAKFTGQVDDRLRSSRSSAAREGAQLIRSALGVLEAFGLETSAHGAVAKVAAIRAVGRFIHLEAVGERSLAVRLADAGVDLLRGLPHLQAVCELGDVGRGPGVDAKPRLGPLRQQRLEGPTHPLRPSGES